MKFGAVVIVLVAGASCVQARPADHPHPASPAVAHHGHCHCPKGYQEQKNSCVATLEVNKLPFCPFEEVPEYPGQCLHQVPAVRLCPGDYKYLPKVGCVDVTNTEPTRKCPDDFVLTAGTCQKTVSHDLIDACPENFVLDDGSCVRLILGTTTVECQDDGVTPVNGKCSYVMSGRNKLRCPMGYVLDTTLVCRRVDFAPAITSCKARFGPRAVLQTLARPTNKKGTCAVKVQYPCGAHRGLAPMMKPALSPSHGHGHGHHQKMCSKVEYYPVKSRCPRGFNPVNTNTDSFVAKAITVGKHGPECFRAQQKQPSPMCIDTIVGGVCTLTQTVPALIECEVTGEIRIGDLCYELDDTAIVPRCPPLFTENQGVCEKLVTLRPRLICPQDAVLTDGSCVATDVLKPQICPSGTRTVHHRCFKTANAIFRCPKGTAPSGQDPTKCILRKHVHPVCTPKKGHHGHQGHQGHQGHH